MLTSDNGYSVQWAAPSPGSSPENPSKSFRMQLAFLEIYLFPMQIIVAVAGTFWQFDLADELESRGYLERIYSTFPWFRLRREGIPRARVRTFPWIHGPWMAAQRYLTIPDTLSRSIQLANLRIFDSWVASRIERCDAFVGLSGSGLKTGSVVQGRGGKYICDRGSSHIGYQRAILNEEYARWGFRKEKVDPRSVAREEAEYSQAEAITVPSEFARRTFIDMRMDPAKIRKIPYGVRLDRFRQTGEPTAGALDVLFAGTVSIRKGIPYLIEAFRKVKHPLKKLRLAGPVEPEMRSLLSGFDLTGVEVLGRQTQAELARLMNMSHALVLPSIEDGFGLVMAQAMACGCVVIATEHTGGPDLFANEVDGFVIPIRSPEAIRERLTQLVDDPALRRKMSDSGLAQVQTLGGWNEYGRRYVAFLQELTGKS